MAIINKQKNIFWIALVVTIIVFNIGIYLGYSLETSRLNKLNDLYANSEFNLFDIKVQSEIFNFDNLNCEIAISENINFADRVYEEASILEKYESAQTLSENIQFQHKKYDLLRTLFWINSMKIKKQCNANYHNIVYFYQYNSPTTDQKAIQSVFSRLLGELRAQDGNKIMLIPISGDNNITSLNLLMKIYNITSLPTILIDENKKITQLETIEQLKKSIS